MKKLDKAYKKAGQRGKASKHNFTTETTVTPVHDEMHIKAPSSVFVTEKVHNLIFPKL